MLMLMLMLLGNITDYKYQNEVGDIEFQWLKEYGGAWKIHDPIGVRSRPDVTVYYVLHR